MNGGRGGRIDDDVGDARHLFEQRLYREGASCTGHAFYAQGCRTQFTGRGCAADFQWPGAAFRPNLPGAMADPPCFSERRLNLVPETESLITWKSYPRTRLRGQAAMIGDLLTIGQVAARVPVHVETIRYYQRQALLEVPPKPAGGIRHYDNRHVSRLRFIKRAQQLGFSLEEVRGLLELDDGQSCRQARNMAQNKLVDVEAKLKDLRVMQRHLKALVSQCQSASGRIGCPLIESLSDPGIGKGSLSVWPSRSKATVTRARSQGRKPKAAAALSQASDQC